MLSALDAEHVLFRPGLMLQALVAHYTAEALLSAPRVLGSLQLLLNPTGLFSSMSAGLADLFGLPVAALMAGSPSQVGMLPILHQPWCWWLSLHICKYTYSPSECCSDQSS